MLVCNRVKLSSTNVQNGKARRDFFSRFLRAMSLLCVITMEPRIDVSVLAFFSLYVNKRIKRKHHADLQEPSISARRSRKSSPPKGGGLEPLEYGQIARDKPKLSTKTRPFNALVLDWCRVRHHPQNATTSATKSETTTARACHSTFFDFRSCAYLSPPPSLPLRARSFRLCLLPLRAFAPPSALSLPPSLSLALALSLSLSRDGRTVRSIERPTDRPPA